MLWLYNGVLAPLRGLVEAWAALRRTTPGAWSAWDERLARRVPEAGRQGAWLHGASVGESRIVNHLGGALRAARPGLPLLGSAMTVTGRAELERGGAVDAATLAPLDFRAYVRRALVALEPRVLALVETELWPNLLHECRERRVPVVLINGRLSESRMVRYRRLDGLYRPLLAGLTGIGAQSEEDAQRFVELGAPDRVVTVTGNVKYDLAPRSDADGVLREHLGLDPRRPVFVAGSTRDGEEALVLSAFERARSTQPDLLLVLAPRHPKRFDEVEGLLRRQRLRHRRTSAGPQTVRDADVLLVDGLGQLAALYRLASVAFVGGTLVPVGGHNLLEPAAQGVPVLFGPHTAAVAGPAAALTAAGGGQCVSTPGELGDRVAALLGNPVRRREMGQRALAVVAENRGALARSVTLLLAALDGAQSRVPAGASR